MRLCWLVFNGNTFIWIDLWNCCNMEYLLLVLVLGPGNQLQVSEAIIFLYEQRFFKFQYSGTMLEMMGQVRHCIQRGHPSIRPCVLSKCHKINISSFWIFQLCSDEYIIFAKKQNKSYVYNGANSHASS